MAVLWVEPEERRVKNSDYVTQETPNSKCPECSSALVMLAPINMSEKKPQFWICFICKRIYRIGFGEIKSLTDIINPRPNKAG